MEAQKQWESKRRLMRKYGLFCPIRQANPYCRMSKAMKTGHVAGNEINRQFRSYARTGHCSPTLPISFTAAASVICLRSLMSVRMKCWRIGLATASE